jgi:hypothetical protein
MADLGKRMISSVLATTLFAACAVAGERPGVRSDRSDQMVIGRGVVCDTVEQIVRFATLVGKARRSQRAIDIVNEEASNPTACGWVVVLFVRGSEIGRMRNDRGPLRIVEITVLAVPDGKKWRSISPLKQYTAFRPQGIDV